MNYRLGNNKNIKTVGETVELTCPDCGEKVSFSVFSNKEMTLVPKFPLVKNGVVYFLVCPNCSHVYGVDEKLGNSFKKGEKLSIGNFDLKELKEFKAFEH